ncbi:MAG: ABC transporter substrate-binding protein [Acidobacteriota bacterium]|nr:ABC transporter substrate-binding protein [Acidobacteriota bacterium]
MASLRRRSCFSLLFIILFAAGACRQPQTSPTGATPAGGGGAATQPTPARERVAGVRGGSLTYRVSQPATTFNYMMAADEPTILISFFLLGGRLVEFDHDRQTYAPALAESWKLNDDKRTVEVTLRENLKFSDGHELTAGDVAFTLKGLYDARTGSPLYRGAMLIGERPIEISVTDARRFKLVFPDQVVVPENYMSNLVVLPRHALEGELNKGALGKAYTVTSAPSGIVTAGPFAVESATAGERYVLKRNPHYWKTDGAGTQLPYLDQIAVEIVADANNAVTRLQQGTLDIVDRIRPTDYASMRSAAGNVRAYDLGPGLYTDHLWFNLNQGQKDGRPVVDPNKLAWFQDVRFRRAVSHAIDRETIASTTLQGLATPLYGFVSPGNRAWFAGDLPRTEYDLDKARALLQEAGFALRGPENAPELFDTKGNRVEFTLIVPGQTEPRVKTATVVQEDLARLGIKMQVAPIENAQISARVTQSYEYEAVLFGVSVTEPDPSSYSDFLRSDSPQHQWYPKQPKPATEWEARLNQLMTAQAGENDPARRRAIFRDAQLILAEQLPVIPLVVRHLTSAATARVGNHRPSALPPYSLWNAEELFIRR